MFGWSSWEMMYLLVQLLQALGAHEAQVQVLHRVRDPGGPVRREADDAVHAGAQDGAGPDAVAELLDVPPERHLNVQHALGERPGVPFVACHPVQAQP